MSNNSYSKIFAVSDVHGHCTILRRALAEAGFDENDPSQLLVCCGDYFDRGNENFEVLRFFERLKHKVLLRGNHEDLLQKLLLTGKILPHNFINGTMQTLTDFFGKYTIDPRDNTVDFSGQNRTVDRIFEFIDNTVDYFELDDYVFVHGWFPSGADTAEKRRTASGESWEKARWVKWTEKYTGERPLKDKILVCGHMPTMFACSFSDERTVDNSDIFYGNGIIALDAGTYDSKRVNVLVIDRFE